MLAIYTGPDGQEETVLVIHVVDQGRGLADIHYLALDADGETIVAPVIAFRVVDPWVRERLWIKVIGS